MPYNDNQHLTEKLGNNIFAWEERTVRHRQSPTLYIPNIIRGSIEDVKIGSKVVFEEMENGKLRSCPGLENFVQLSDSMVVFDNHNHALYFWIDAIRA